MSKNIEGKVVVITGASSGLAKRPPVFSLPVETGCWGCEGVFQNVDPELRGLRCNAHHVAGVATPLMSSHSASTI